MEVMVASAISTVMLVGGIAVMQKMIRFRGTANSLAQIKTIEAALETTYRQNVTYIEDNCLGWTAAGCNTLTLVPRRHATNNTILLLRTYLDAVTQAWVNAGCTVTGTAPTYVVKCNDGYVTPYTFETTNEHTPNTYYTGGYSNTPYTITITSGGNADITDTWSAGYLDVEYLTYSKKKLLELVGALKQYHLSRLVHEAITTCDSVNGGLQSFDDVLTPWYWQVVGTTPQQTCTGIEAGTCGCSILNDTTKWRTTASGYPIVNTVAEFTTVLGNLGLNTKYRVDGFGNALQLWLTVDSAGATAAAPPRPQLSYDGLWTVKPPYRSLVGVYYGSAWVYQDVVVYPQ